MQSNSKNELVKLLSICGQVAEHKSEKIQEHGGDEAAVLDVLTQEEQDILKELLTKLQKNWIEGHREHMAKQF